MKQLYYQHCNKGTQDATIAQLTDTLIEIADHGNGMYIIVDALDESSDWKALLKVVDIILQSKINLLMTSRKEHDIEIVLANSVDFAIAIQDERVDADVCVHVEQCLQHDPDLSKWDDDLKSEIVTSLTAGAQGM